MESESVKNKRIAKNTVFLYARTLLIMLVSLYTSRIVLKALGVDNYGVYDVVGGFVAMFAIVTSPISNAISRFLIYGLGKGDLEHLKKVYSTSVNILLLLGLIVVLIGETFGIWFLNQKLNIPPESMTAANWVLQCSIFSTVLGLINIPNSATIIAHEKMSIYAYMSILEACLKLGLAFSVLYLPFNSLITYAIGLLIISLILRASYVIYCSSKFQECKYTFGIDKKLFKEMTGFAWWTFLGNTAFIFNNQGSAMLMNIFFGVVINTAKGLAATVQSAVMNLINSFTTAFTPQITKSYAEGNFQYMYSVMSRGSKFSVFIMLLFLIPLEFEAPIVLKLWLGEVPPFATLFLRLTLLCSFTNLIGTPFLQGIMATGKIKKYQIAMTLIGCTVFPLTWLTYKLGGAVQMFYWIFVIIYNILIWVRMIYVQELLGYKVKKFAVEVFLPILRCTILSAIPGIIISYLMEDSYLRLIVLTLVTLIFSSLIIYRLGMTNGERNFIMTKIKNRLNYGY
ncbi:MAG: lipopolysaccharide biosynthesis protein [Muribaculaceae bacterium]|nr:lipopolysaccharide biosynthesis protein [Muribaculaceae bacterium]